MIKIKSIEQIIKKYAARTAVAAGDYKDQVLATTDQASKAAADSAEEAYQLALQDSFGRKARQKGLVRVGNKKWQQRAATLGAQRYPSGTRAGAPLLGTNFQPFREVIAALDLTPRGPKGSPENFDRSKAVGQALHEKKIQLQSG